MKVYKFVEIDIQSYTYIESYLIGKNQKKSDAFLVIGDRMIKILL